MNPISIYETWELDDWSMSKEMFLHITQVVPANSTILELGSGATTNILGKFFNMISIEHDSRYLNSKNTTYIHAPLLSNDWYDPTILEQELRRLSPKYDAIVIDGPAGPREIFFQYKHLFNLNVPIFIDDVMEGQKPLQLCKDLANYLGRPYHIYQCQVNPKVVYWFDGKKYAYIPYT